MTRKIGWLDDSQGRYRINCAPGSIHKFILHKGNGPEATESDCSLGDHFKDLSNLRFTQSDGITPFSDYCIEVVDGDRAVVWIKFTTDMVCIYPGAEHAAAAKNQVPPA